MYVCVCVTDLFLYSPSLLPVVGAREGDGRGYWRPGPPGPPHPGPYGRGQDVVASMRLGPRQNSWVTHNTSLSQPKDTPQITNMFLRDE
jgi:hypothetical protein